MREFDSKSFPVSGDPSDSQRPPQQTRWATELLHTLNTAAHVPATITDLHYITFLGISQNLLASLNADSSGLQEINQLVETVMSGARSQTVESSASEPAQTTPQVVNADESPSDSESLTTNSTDSPAVSYTEVTTPAPPSSAPSDGRPNLYNTLTADEERTQTEFTFERFAPHIQVNPWGLEFEFISVGSMRMVVAYRRDLNYALVHNRVSVLAGIGIFFDDPEEGDSTHHTVTGLTAHLGSLAAEEQHRWTTPDLSIFSREQWAVAQSDLAWSLPPSKFIDIDEAQPETLELEFTVDGQVVQRSIALRVLAHDQWSPSTVPEIIAAFIRPRSEAVNAILLKASDLLGTRTGDPSLVGYQDSPERTVETARAIYDAIRTFEIRYAEPPASFEETGSSGFRVR